MSVALEAPEHPSAEDRGLVLSVLGSSHAVRCAHLGLISSIRRLWSPFLVESSTRGDGAARATAYDLAAGRLDVDGQTVVTGATPPWLLANFAAELNARALSAYEGFAVHAGVVSRDGASVAFPGVSGAGKSTLTAAACAAGFDYVSDESLCVRYEDGGVEPYQKPFALSPWSAESVGLPVWTGDALLDERFYAPQQLGTTLASDPLRLAHVVLPERGHGRATLTELDRSMAVHELLRKSFNHFRRPAETFGLVTALASSLRVWRLTYGKPLEAGQVMAERLT